jgi:radical SAM superfamily enzyme YgiQ (UPF0313 family)
MDLLLTHGYFLDEDPAERAIMRPYPPLGLLYISSHLKARGIPVRVFDSTFASRAEFEREIDARKPRLVGIYVTLMTRRNVIWMIKKAKAAGATVILGGPEPVNYAEEYLSRGADFIVAGEGEQTLTEFITARSQGDCPRYEDIDGLVFRNTQGEIIKNRPRAQLPGLDAQPFPDRDAIDLEKYLETWRTHHGVRSISVITARGCPYTCRWCSHSVYGFTHRRRSPENVADEIEALVQRYRPDQVWYADDVFTINKRWIARYAAELERRSIRLPFETITREDRLDESVIETLAAMGCYRIWIGAESGSQRILDAMDRRTDATRMRTMIRSLRRHGIRAGTFIMLGYEGEAWSDLDATAQHLRDSLPDDLLTTVAYPIKGTPYYDDVAAKVVALRPWEQGSDRDLTVLGRFSAGFYGHAQRWLSGELAMAREWQRPDRSYLRLAKATASAKTHRLAMHLRRHERQER